MIRAAIVGCGKIADQHVAATRRIGDCAVVAVCDREPLMADQLAERFSIPQRYDDVAEMLRAEVPDVVHITTPPQSHFSLGRQCLESGSHVYLEKPFTVTANEAESLVRLAESLGLKVAAGHNYQFTPEMLEMRKLISNGYLGGPAVHVESHWPYDLSDTTYVGPLLGNRNHWVRQLPGRLLHNILSHGVARLAEFLGDRVQVSARAHQSARMRSLGVDDVFDELRVLIRDQQDTTAFFCFSSSIKPGVSQLRVFGPVNSLLVDQRSGSLIRSRGRTFKSYLTFVALPLTSSAEYYRSARMNLLSFFRGRLHHDSGMKELIEQFYVSIRNRSAPPIPYREIILTARIMEEIFAQIYRSEEADDDKAAPILSQGTVT